MRAELDDLVGYVGEASGVEAVTLGTRALAELVQEGDAVVVVVDHALHVAHAHLVLLGGELLHEMVVVSGEESATVDLLRQLLHHTVGNGCAVEGGRAATELVHEHQRMLLN